MLLLLIGCQSSPPPATRPTAVVASSEAQLHEISGQLLLYYSMNRHLPATLDELRSMPEADSGISYIDPNAHQPFVYDRAGLTVPNRPGRVIVYSPRADHSGLRWTITIEGGGEGQPLITRVVAIPQALWPSSSVANPG